MKSSSLHNIPESYWGKFAQKSSSESPIRFWGYMLIYVLFLLPELLFMFNEDFPIVFWFSITVIALQALFLLPTLFFSSKKTIDRFRKYFVLFKFVAVKNMSLLLVNLCATIYVAISTTLLKNDSLVVSVVYVIVGALLMEDVVVTILFWKAMKRRIVVGKYREDNSEFQGKKELPKAKKYTIIIASIAGVAIALRVPLLVINNFAQVTLTESILPFMALLFFFTSNLFVIALSYTCAQIISRFTYLKLYDKKEIKVS